MAARPADPGTALVTGASVGIGRELARQFAAGGYDVAGVARRKSQLDALANDLESRHGVETAMVPMDLTEPDAADRLEDAVRDRGLRVDALVNNAGIGAYGPFQETDLDRELDQVRLNVQVPVHLTKLFLPGMVERDEGVVLNVASLGAVVPGPKLAGYYASKAHLRSLSEAIAEELSDTGVAVTALCPGPVDTEFQERAGMTDSVIGSTFAHTPEEVARAGYRGAMAGKPVVVPGAAAKVLYHLSGLAPRTLRRKAAAWLNDDR
ncbi:MAG: SDR family oxidoreductase [Halobacteriales archaeon]